MWWGKSATLPPLVTTSPTSPTLTPQAQAGVLGQPGTSILFGNSADLGIHSGGRFSLGYWFSPCHDGALEVTYTVLGNKALDFSQTSQGDPILAQPFFNVQTSLQSSVLIAYPNQQTGTINIRVANELDSVEVLFRQALLQQCGEGLDLLVGYRYGRFAENLAVNSLTTFTSAVGVFPQNTIVQVSDGFAASNEFNGAELGLVTKGQYCRWSLELLAKLALGSTRSRMTINGSSVVSAPDQTPVTHASGLLALPTNIGDYQRTAFAVIPELGATVGFDLTCRLKATVGYTFVYWSQVVRPGDHIDTNLNPSQFQGGQLTGVPSPQFRFVTSDFWAQGFNVGFDYRF